MHGTKTRQKTFNRVRYAKLTGLNGVEEICALSLLLNVCIDEERVCFGMNVLHHDLETVEASSLWYLNLVRKSLEQVLIDNAI